MPGPLAAALAYVLWGIFPLYIKQVSQVPALEIVAHRSWWSVVFLFALLAATRRLAWLRDLRRQPRMLALTALSALLLTSNWLLYVWAVNADRILDASLGYFINPLVNVLLGVLFMGERLRPMQWAPVGLAAAGVIYLTASYGSLPWISLVLAFSFGLYGLVKKAAPLGALHGITLETGLLCLPALGYLLVVEGQGAGAFGHMGALETFMLAFSGVVTAIPLLLFAGSARRIPLSMMGIIQYISPTLQFLIGIWAFNEAFSGAKLVGFVIIWLALLLYSVEGLMERRRVMHAQAAQV